MIKTLTRRSFLRNVFFAVLTVALSLGVGACSSDSGTSNSSNNGSLSGTLTFTYMGESITAHSDKWPHSGSTSDNFPSGFFRIGLIPSYSTGVPASGPTKVLPAGTTTGSGMTYAQLTNGTYAYTFDKIGKGTYIIAPTYENINDKASDKTPSFRDVVATGFYSNAMAGFGSTININDDAHPNIDIYCDIAIGDYAYTTMKSVNNGGTVGAFLGGVKLSNPANWPTGVGSVLAIAAYKTATSKATANGVTPDSKFVINKPTLANVDMMAYKLDLPLGQEYKYIIIDVFTNANCTNFVNAGNPALATYTTLPITLTKTTPNMPIVVWNTNVTAP